MFRNGFRGASYPNSVVRMNVKDSINSISQDFDSQVNKFFVSKCVELDIDPDALIKLTMKVKELEIENSALQEALVDITTDHYKGDPEELIDILNNYIKSIQREPKMIFNEAYCPFCNTLLGDSDPGKFDGWSSECPECGQYIVSFLKD